MKSHKEYVHRGWGIEKRENGAPCAKSLRPGSLKAKIRLFSRKPEYYFRSQETN